MARIEYNRRGERLSRRPRLSERIIPFTLRLILAAVFIFSGFAKAVDPLGTAYKIEEYARAFGGLFEYLIPVALPLSIVLCSFELFLGFALLFKLRYRLTYILSLIFMSVMTLITLYTAIKNPVTDCGCFGDVLQISNRLTFVKNLVLLLFVVVLFFYRKRSVVKLPQRLEFFLFLFFFLSSFSFTVYSSFRLPIIDFRPYRIGVNIQEGMQIPEGAARDEYSISFVYEKEGKQKEFTMENYPKNDSTWKFVDQKRELVSKGYEPPIHDFIIENEEYDDITDSVLNYEGKAYLLIAYDLNKTHDLQMQQAQRMYNKTILLPGEKFYALTASSDEEIALFRERTGVTYPFYRLDPTTLKTIIRSNPGLVILKKGTIEEKWHWRDFAWK